jgi:hypothetical protein
MSVQIFQLGAWLRAIGQRLLAAILRVSVEETAAELTEATVAAKRRTVAAAMEALDYAASLDGQGDEVKQQILSAFKADIGEIATIGRDVLSGTISPAAGQETLGGAPFGSAHSGTISASKPPVPLPRPEPSAPPGQPETGSPPPAATPRRRGRPPKHPRPEATA